MTSLLVNRVTIPAPDPTPTTCGTCRNFRQLPNASGTSDGISPTTCGGQLPEDLPTLWQRARELKCSLQFVHSSEQKSRPAWARCLLWVSVGVASIERAVHRRRFLDLSGGISSGTVCSSIQKTTTDTLINITDSTTQYQFCTLDTTKQNSIGEPSGRSALRSDRGSVHGIRTERDGTRPASAPTLTGGRGKIITKASPRTYQNQRVKICTKTLDK